MDRTLIAALMVASASTACGSPPADAGLAAVTRAAIDDAARRTGLAPDVLRVVNAERVVWADGSLGCPQPGLAYTQALVPGYRVRIEANGVVHDYHAALRGPPRWCAPERAQEPLPDDARRSG